MIKVLIVDDQELFRESLKVVLSVSENIRVTDAVSGVAQALKSAEQDRPDVVLMDMRMPGMDGVEGTRLFKKRWPDIKIIVLTTFDDDDYIFGALKHGASSYLLKGSSISKLSESIRIAYEDGAIITPAVATKVINQFSQMAQGSARIQADKEAVKDISRSEWQIIQTVGSGMSNKEIAQELSLSEGTVRNSISNILFKLGLRDRTQLAIWAVQTGGGESSAMKKWIWKQNVVILLAVTLCLCLAACGRNQETVLTIGVYSGSYWNTPNGNSYQILDDAISLFEQSHPGMKVEYASGIPAGDYSEWLAEQLLKGTEPDLYFVLPEDFDLLVSSGALAGLDERIAADPEFDTSLYYESCLRSGQFEGRQYALPHESVPTIMFVNKTLLEMSGVEMPDNDWTWEDFYSICAQITDVEQHRYGVYGYTWLDAIHSNGASLFSEDGRSCYLAEENVLEAIAFSKQLGELSGGYNVSARDFDEGRVAFQPLLYSEYRAYQPYPWRVKKYSAFQWDCVSMPAGPSGSNISELHTMMLGISSRTRHGDLAWEFCKLLSINEDVQRKLYTSSHGISPLRAVAEDPELLQQIHHDIPEGSGFSPEMIRRIMDNAVVVPRFDAYDQAMNMVESAIQESVGNQLGQSRMLIAQSDINIFLNKS